MSTASVRGMQLAFAVTEYTCTLKAGDLSGSPVPFSISQTPEPHMLKLDSIAADTELERAGQYIEIPGWEGVSLGVRSIELPAYKIAFEQTVERLARKHNGKPVPPEDRETEAGKLLAKHILFDWKGISPEYSAESASEFLSSPRGRHLANKVLWAARQVAKVEEEYEEQAVKN